MNQSFSNGLRGNGNEKRQIVYIESGIRPAVNFSSGAMSSEGYVFMSASRANPFSDWYSLAILYLNPIFSNLNNSSSKNPTGIVL